jgi:putative aldouronate transport system permease protein
VIYLFVFEFVPFYGLTIAFKDFQVFKGIWASPWVGFDNFAYIFSSEKFPELLKNTILIHVYRLFFGFPVPILFALLLNEVRHMVFKRTVQTLTYFPHFLSWVIFGGVVINIIGPSGVVNLFMRNLGLEPIQFLTSTDLFRPVLVVTGILKEFGWHSIIYLAALSGIDPTLYEAAKVDGAKKLRQIWHVTLPGIRPMIILLLIINIGHIMNSGFDQIFNLYNPMVYKVADIIDTYVYRVGLQQGDYEVATAIGLFKGVVGMVLVIIANFLSRKLGGKSLW